MFPTSFQKIRFWIRKILLLDWNLWLMLYFQLYIWRLSRLNPLIRFWVRRFRLTIVLISKMQLNYIKIINNQSIRMSGLTLSKFLLSKQVIIHLYQIFWLKMKCWKYLEISSLLEIRVIIHILYKTKAHVHSILLIQIK
jgi:hypothetical protein